MDQAHPARGTPTHGRCAHPLRLVASLLLLGFVVLFNRSLAHAEGETLVFGVDADTFVSDKNPDTNFDDDDRLRVDGDLSLAHGLSLLHTLEP